ncbi:MAG: GGDEF domain-containing protein [Eubacterium sp.]|nr:GGDEF domain-containing protein [Eubacterium sp.]
MKRKTICFLVSGLMDDFTIKLCNGVMSEASHLDINLVVVPVKYIDRDLTGLQDKYEYQYKTNASNLLPENIDALLVAADCIGCLTTKENLMDFIHSLPKVPTVMVASKVEGYPGVIFDNKVGVRDGLTYLVEKLGIRRIGMLGGSEKHVDAKERRDAYDEIRQKYDLPYRETMFVETNISLDCQNEVELLLDMNPDLEAVFCVNDDVARTTYQVLRARGLEPGKDVKILGFDNSQMAAMVSPALSTVDADAIELGRHGLRMVMRALEGENPGVETTPTRFILRDSFGGLEETVRKSDGLLNRSLLNRQFDQIFYRYRDVEQMDASKLRNNFLLLMEEVISYVESGQHDDWQVRELKDKINTFFTKEHALEYTDNNELMPYIERLHAEAAERFGTPEAKLSVYRMLISVYKRILNAMSDRTVQYESGMDAMLYSMKTIVKDTLNFTYGNDKSYESIVQPLANVGFRNAFVYIYEKSIVHLDQEPFEVPKMLRIKAALTDGEVRDVPYIRQPVSLKSIFNHRFLPKEKWTMVLMPLYFGDTVYGSVLVDLNNLMFRNGEFMVNQFATTARMIEILRQNNEIQKQLEENLAVMAENNIVLDRLSRNDVLTGILNRRGFFDIARSVIAECKEMKIDVIFSYVDMNNLKVINDRFGHDDGDFALRAISQVLTEVVSGNGTVGRIGGDEYAFIYYGKLSEEELRKEISERFRKMNEESDKPYNVTVSCGFYRIHPEEEISVDDAMASADEDLYRAKQFKDNRVVK